MNGDLLLANLTSPMVLAFALGAFATLVKSDLRLPSGLYTSLSMYLLFAIGLKGGVALSETSLAEMALPALATLLLGCLTALIAFFVARKIGRFATADAASLAAHYGSVSAVTFIASQSFARDQGIAFEGYLPALVAVLEVPAILLALFLAGRGQGGSFRELAREMITGRTVILLVGGLAIGAVAARDGYEQVEPLFGDLFKGALTFFLLEMGLLAAQQLKALGKNALFLGLFGVVVPLINGGIGVAVATGVGMTPGGAGVVGAMAASASYIAAPAAVRVAIPEANLGLSLGTSLGVTFPFNLAVGIPFFLVLAQAIAR